MHNFSIYKIQSVSTRIWTRVAVSISYDDNHSSTGGQTKAPSLSYYVWIAE